VGMISVQGGECGGGAARGAQREETGELNNGVYGSLVERLNGGCLLFGRIFAELTPGGRAKPPPNGNSLSNPKLQTPNARAPPGDGTPGWSQRGRWGDIRRGYQAPLFGHLLARGWLWVVGFTVQRTTQKKGGEVISKGGVVLSGIGGDEEKNSSVFNHKMFLL